MERGGQKCGTTMGDGRKKWKRREKINGQVTQSHKLNLVGWGALWNSMNKKFPIQPM